MNLHQQLTGLSSQFDIVSIDSGGGYFKSSSSLNNNQRAHRWTKCSIMPNICIQMTFHKRHQYIHTPLSMSVQPTAPHLFSSSHFPTALPSALSTPPTAHKSFSRSWAPDWEASLPWPHDPLPPVLAQHH